MILPKVSRAERLLELEKTQGQNIERHLHISIKWVDISPLWSRQKSIIYELDFANMTVFDLIIKTVELGNIERPPTFEIVNAYTLPLNLIYEHNRMVRAGEATIYKIGLDAVNQENAELILAKIKQDEILWRLELNWFLNILGLGEREVTTHLKYSGVPVTYKKVE